MGFGQAITTCFGKYVSFQGRARRSEFWWFYLFVVIVSLITQLVDQVIGLWIYRFSFDQNGEVVQAGGFGILSTIWFLVILLPMLSVMVRRLHDTDRSGWWWWLNLLCCIGPIVLLVFYILPGTQGANRFGPDPTSA